MTTDKNEIRIALAGNPNVGKSTLFNKLIGERRAIVEDTPGVTRDRIYEECEWCGRVFDLVDTGGIEPTTDSEILLFMREQAQIAINSATFVGIQVAGLPGAIIATVACIFPSCVIVMTLAYIYYRFRGLNMVQGILAGLRPAVIAMIASAGISLLIMALYGQRTLPNDLTSLDVIAVIVFVIGIFVLRKWKPNPLWVMTGCGAAGVILYSIV